MNYYYLEDGQVSEPCTYKELEQLFNQGVINVDTLIAEEGSQNWQSFGAYYRRKNPAARRSFVTRNAPPSKPKKQPVICVIFNVLGYLCLASAVASLLLGFINHTEMEGVFNALSAGAGCLFWLFLSYYINKKCY